MDIKAIYQRFRAWQLEPFNYTPSEEHHQCANCRSTFEGNYCPVCGQKHNVGRVGWDNVEQDVKKLVGNKNSRSLISFFMQLFGRSGYMISDYISGRRQVCSSPVTMLGLIAAGTLLVLNSTGKAPHAGDALVTDGRFGMMGMGLEWMSSHLNLAILIETALLVFPTWLLFRFAPKHYKHTLPEGIYIQVFMGSLVLFGIMLRAALSD